MNNNNNNKASRINSYSDDLLLLIFVYFTAKELFQIDGVCVLWHQILRQNDKLLYEPLIHLLFQNKSFNIPKRVNVLDKIESLSLSNLKKSLLGIDLHRCIEKKDFQRMVLARSIFSQVMERQLSGDDPRFKGKYLSMFYPDWSLVIPPWKASFQFYSKDIHRKTINMHELCQIKWVFQFKNVSQEDLAMYGQQNWQMSFRDDFTMYSELQGHEMQWKFVDYPDGIPRIQVENYPALTSFRKNNGAWGLENMHVVIQQKDNIANFDDIPLVIPL